MYPVSSGRLRGLGEEPFERLQALIEASIQQNNLETAEFQCEILVGEGKREEASLSQLHTASYYYGLVLYLRGKIQIAWDAVSPFKTQFLGCSYVLARCALQLKDSYCREAATALAGFSKFEERIGVDASASAAAGPLFMAPDEATLHCVLGQLYMRLGRTSESAAEHYKALTLNPYLWESLRAMCELRSDFSVGKLYVRRQSNRRVQSSLGTRPRRGLILKPHTPFKVPAFDSKRKNVAMAAQQQPHSLNKTKHGVQLKASNISMTSTTGNGNTHLKSRLLATPPSKLAASDRVVSPVNLSNDTSGSLTGFEPTGLIDSIFYALGKAYKSACQYDCYKAIRFLSEELPPNLLSTMPWVLACLGKLHFEIVNYEMSNKYFKALRKLQPKRVEDMEIYSTLLWHFRDAVELSALSRELVSFAKLAPQTWICVGNFFSQKGAREKSIQAFQWSVELDPKFAYGYTLQGHDHSSNDAFDTARTCYRQALAVNSQHYNAHYGLGMCALKLGHYEESLLHFERARGINPANVILLCCCGVALEKLDHQDKALDYYDLACELQPTSSLALFKKAQLLFTMAKYNSALENFETLRALAPEEATVHFLLGQLYQIIGRRQDAVNAFTVALNLDRKGSQVIKAALEKCYRLE
ncbi:LAMI_0D05028g1_1 [Lachancea mirantina]|uniref:LAMI_0D05028g1_1 n=1 Tax=Lachancea mirantina TaxID=1230905 RepID=A0A1G4JBH9_9SACH|nr:LAMI_0D05028g1_1 [Lachancea mirantina]